MPKTIYVHGLLELKVVSSGPGLDPLYRREVAPLAGDDEIVQAVGPESPAWVFADVLMDQQPSWAKAGNGRGGKGDFSQPAPRLPTKNPEAAGFDLQ